MPFEQQEPVNEIVSPESSISVTPHIPSPSLSDISVSHGSDSETPDLNLFAIYEKIEIPTEPTLKDILQNAVGENDLTDITEIKIQVITNDISLQHLNIYIPKLTELNLDGSVISSLRDLGCGLTNLKILRVCRCKLTSLDGMSGFENIEQLYAQNNKIKDLIPCSWLPYIQIINLKRNFIKDINSVSFLSLCSSLEHLVLDENKDLTEIPEYRNIIRNLLPDLKTLDDKDMTEEEISPELSYLSKVSPDSSISSKEEDRVSQSPEGKCPSVKHKNTKLHNLPSKRCTILEGNVQFTAMFPPKVLSPRPSSSESSSHSTITTTYRNELPDIPEKRIPEDKSEKNFNSLFEE